MVTTLLREFNYQNEDGCINKISLSLSHVDKTNVTLLNSLQDNGMKFSTAAQNLIRVKEEYTIGVLDQFGIALMRFSEFLKRHVLRHNQEIKINGELPPIKSEKKHTLVFDDESEDESELHSAQEKMECASPEQSLKQNTNDFKEFKEQFYALVSPAREAETKTELKESSFKVSP